MTSVVGFQFDDASPDIGYNLVEMGCWSGAEINLGIICGEGTSNSTTAGIY